jgi:hypothetical protein
MRLPHTSAIPLAMRLTESPHLHRYLNACKHAKNVFAPPCQTVFFANARKKNHFCLNFFSCVTEARNAAKPLWTRIAGLSPSEYPGKLKIIFLRIAYEMLATNVFYI